MSGRRILVGLVVTFASLVLCVCMVTVYAIAGGAVVEDGSTTVTTACLRDDDLAPILATIRALESGGDYTIRAKGSTAAGAYQMLTSTWANYGGYPSADVAPPDVQDRKAAELVRAVLTKHRGDVAAVPVVWYLGHLPAADSPTWDTVPVPGAGNVLTPRQYQTKWLAEYARQLAAGGDEGMACTVSAGTYTGEFAGGWTCAALTWGGYANGHVSFEAMRYQPHSGYLHPQASLDYDEMYHAAMAVGIDLRGSGYRSADAQAQVHAGGTGAPVGRSCHGVGLALDIAVLVPCSGGRCALQPYRTLDEVFASPEWAWLCANAHHYGWINPRWAHPEGVECTGVVGTGTGGGQGVIEPWHVEAAGAITTHPDFAGVRG